MFDIANAIADWLFPRRCLVCSTDIAMGSLCESCRSFCHRCPARFDEQNHSAIFLFELTIREVIKNAKFYRNILQINLLYKLLLEEMENDLIDEIRKFSPEAITFVPSHWLHRISRGTEIPALFAGILSWKLGVPLIPMLEKINFLSRQALRKRKSERKAIKGSFSIKRNIPVFSRILLVDDIVTTGATFNELKMVLREKYQHIRCVAIAKTP